MRDGPIDGDDDDDDDVEDETVTKDWGLGDE